MSFEVDIRAVGKESSSGDAIVLRYGNLGSPDQKVVVIDGGYTDTGDELVEFIKSVYGTPKVDLVISSHPDSDHVAGLGPVVEQLEVDELWMHLPWNHADSVKKYLLSGTSARTFSEPMKKALKGATLLELAARKKGIPITEPFTGLTTEDGRVQVLGPSQEYFEDLVGEFGMTAVQSLGKALSGLAGKVKTRIRETWDKEELVEPAPDAVNNRNNSSAIVRIDLGEASFLLTADAGVPALTRALDYGDTHGVQETHVQLPHHGSKRNVGPTVLNRMLGEKGNSYERRAFISSAAKGRPKHPSQRVVNAARRRSALVGITGGRDICYKSSDVPLREGWGPLKSADFEEFYEEEE